MIETTPREPLKLSQLPLFPLESVLLPGGELSLRVFEVRYLDMIQRCERAGAPFGVVLLTRGSEVQQPAKDQQHSSQGTPFAKEDFESVGTLASIVDIQRPQNGLLMVHCRGTSRFSIQNRRRLPHGLWVADVLLTENDPVVSIPVDLHRTRDGLKNVLTRIRSQREAAGQAVTPVPEERWDDAGWVANRWLELVPVVPMLKQRLMALDNPLVRLELVADVLEKLGVSEPSSGNQ